MIKFLQLCQHKYTDGCPILSDEEFDALAEEHNFYEVGSVPTSKEVPHEFQMFSLQKVYDDEPSPIYGMDAVTTPKLDGAAISLLYKNGTLVQAATRGNGIIGQDITDKAYLLDSIPDYIEDCVDMVVQITGEIVAPKTIENARNYAAGALNLKDLQEFKERDIQFVAYGVYPPLYCDYEYRSDMKGLEYWGFTSVLSSGLDKYPQDGTVARVNSNTQFYKMGNTAKHPKGAFARKKSSDMEVKEATLLSVEWGLGAGGKVSPVAIFTEVLLDDAKVSRATLHNAEFIEKHDLHIGDTLLVRRSGMVIPQIMGKV